MANDYVLSICMMVKDEEKNLPRCLNALKPLLEKQDVELIIVDTGSTDKTPDISRQYTDKVYCHPWENNFSEMRNITISYAHGDYIFILDADEVLQDPLMLYNLAADKKTRAYNTFIAKIKNMNSTGGYTIAPQLRVFRNDGGFRYEGAVHNQPLYKFPLLNTSIYIEHYGYMFNDKALLERKFKRTGEILMAGLKKEPENIYYRYQMARTYSAHGDQEEAFGEIEKAYSLICGDPDKKRQFVYIYDIYSKILLDKKRFFEAIAKCKEGLEIQPEYVDLYYITAVAKESSGDKNGAKDTFIKFLDLVQRYDELKISADGAMEMYYMGDFYLCYARRFAANQLYEQGNYTEAHYLTEGMTDKKDQTSLQAKILMRSGRYDDVKDLYVKNIGNKSVRDIIINAIEVGKVPLDLESKRKVELVFSDGNDIYSLLNKVRFSGGHGDPQILTEADKAADFNELPDFFADLFIGLDFNSRQVSSILKKVRKTKIQQFCKRILEQGSKSKKLLEDCLIKANIRDDDYQSLRVFTGIAFSVLLNKASSITQEKGEVPSDYYSIFRLYVQRGQKYAALLYKDERLRMYYNTLEDMEDRFFISLKYAEEAVGKGDFKNGIKYFRESARANPYMSFYMKIYLHELFPDNNTDSEDELND